VLAALGAGRVAESWHTGQLKQKRSFALSLKAVYSRIQTETNVLVW
jgi:hypothetical protein